MNLNFKAFLRSIGMLFLVIGITMIVPLIVSLIYKEYAVTVSFATVIFPVLIAGIVIYRVIIPNRQNLTLRDGFLIVPVWWIGASIIGAIPLVISGAMPDWIDAFFEIASGLTTTGASALTDIESLPKSILYWRSFTHWIGGMGILIFAVAILPSLGMGANILASAEAPGPTMDKITPKMSDTAKNLYRIYALLTVLQIALHMLTGMDWYDASTNAFATLGTGGFSPYNGSIVHFDSTAAELIIGVFMILAGVNFNLYYYSLVKEGGIKNLLKDEEFRLYIFLIGIATALVAWNLISSSVYKVGDALRFSFFQVGSIITTTGFSSADYDLWPAFSKMVLVMLMFVGGCSSSTGGGIKVIRILVIMKLIKRGIQVQLHPNAIISIKVNDKKLSIDNINLIASMMFLHIVVVAVSTVLVSLDGKDLLSSFTAVLACVGNIGPGLNLVGPTMDFSIFSAPVTLLLSLLMIAGRLELYTFFMIFVPAFWRRYR